MTPGAMRILRAATFRSPWITTWTLGGTMLYCTRTDQERHRWGIEDMERWTWLYIDRETARIILRGLLDGEELATLKRERAELVANTRREIEHCDNYEEQWQADQNQGLVCPTIADLRDIVSRRKALREILDKLKREGE